jgi:hydroxymethylbilane synthase
VPLGAYAERFDDEIAMRGFVASIDGREMLRAEARGDAADPEALGRLLADRLVAQGADRILAALADYVKPIGNGD